MTQRKVCHYFVTWCIALGSALIFFAGVAFAQRADEENVHVDRFTNRYWSQIRPDRAYLNGCITGYRAFSFSGNGYFIFDRRIHGTWRVDRFDNLILRTRDGVQFKLFFDHQQTLTPSVNGAFIRRDQRFQECRD